MKRAYWLLVFCLLIPGSVHAAQWNPVGEGGEAVSISVLESGELRTVLEYRIGGFATDEVLVNGVPHAVIALPKESGILEAGFPYLPRVCRSVMIPDNARMAVNILDQRYEELATAPVAPSKGNLLRTVNPQDVPYTFDEFYQTDAWYPAEVVSHRDPYILRDFRGMTILFNPFQYNPATQSLRVTTYLKIEVVAVGVGQVNVIERIERPLRLSRDFEQIYESRFLNFTLGRYASVGEQGEMLVITYDDFRSTVEPLVQWKNEMGMRTRIFDVSGVGSTPVEIKQFIRAYRDTVPDLVYVLLVGDGPQVPPMHTYGDASDPRYSLMDGDDYYPELVIGRFSAQNVSQVETQVQRTIDYEKYPQAGASWYHKGTGIGSNEGPGDDGELDREHIDNIRTDLLDYTYTLVDQIYDPGAGSSQVTSALNSGRSILNYCGHGSISAWGTTGFSSYRVNQLANDGMLPFIFDVACVNGKFENYSCFAEAWLRATNSSNGNPTGAIGVYASSVNQSWNPPMVAQDEMNDLLVQDSKRTFGGLCYNGSCQMMDEHGWDGAAMFKTWHVFGDPSLRIRTDTPIAISVNHTGSISSRATSYTVTVPGVEGALCGLSYEGDFIGAGLTDPYGVAMIDIEAALPENRDILLTVTAYNRIPVFEPVTVTTDPTGVTVRTQTHGELSLIGNYPNPFNPMTTVTFSVPERSAVRMDVYSVTGAHVRALVARTYDAGTHHVVWDGTNTSGVILPGGVYLCRMQCGDAVMTKKMVMAK
ncbi:MAG: hypothetical protein KAW17_05825 [Candidatus Eisenbacteria sp.]|nr:hypothetical protein [Candidatus Eisenbacteria bacterium]